MTPFGVDVPKYKSEQEYLQGITDALERYKRQQGRRFAICQKYEGDPWLEQSMNAWREYNNLENLIQFMVDEMGCTRKSKAYKLIWEDPEVNNDLDK